MFIPPLSNGMGERELVLLVSTLFVQETRSAVMQNSGLCACLIDATAIADISHVAGLMRDMCRSVRCARFMLHDNVRLT
jgi:hypothetical protein